MSAAARLRLLELVRAVKPQSDGRARFTTQTKRGARARLEALVGKSRAVELVDDGGVIDLGLTGGSPILWRQALVLRVRYDAPATSDRGALDDAISQDTRALIAALRVPSAWAGPIDQLIVGDDPSARTEVHGEDTLVALIEEIPLTIEFYE